MDLADEVPDRVGDGLHGLPGGEGDHWQQDHGHGRTSENIQNYDKYFSQSSCLCLFDWVEGWNPQRF